MGGGEPCPAPTLYPAQARPGASPTFHSSLPPFSLKLQLLLAQRIPAESLLCARPRASSFDICYPPNILKDQENNNHHP